MPTELNVALSALFAYDLVIDAPEDALAPFAVPTARPTAPANCSKLGPASRPRALLLSCP